MNVCKTFHPTSRSAFTFCERTSVTSSGGASPSGDVCGLAEHKWQRAKPIMYISRPRLMEGNEGLSACGGRGGGKGGLRAARGSPVRSVHRHQVCTLIPAGVGDARGYDGIFDGRV